MKICYDDGMKIRKATTADLGEIMDVYARARRFMAEHGNPNQWVNGHPAQELIQSDVESGKSYVMMSESGETAGVFYFAVEAEPTYARIDGAWLNGAPYGIVHRIASNGKEKGVVAQCVKWCMDRCENLRMDTHADNAVMQNALLKLGFVYCGIIYLKNGAERLAYQKIKSYDAP